jgi:hypothetical protein
MLKLKPIKSLNLIWRSIMKHYIISIILLLSIFGCTTKNKPGQMATDADPTNIPDLVGTYVVNGIDPIGDEYGGHLTITAGEDAGTYNLQWIVTGGIQEGFGVVKGNQLSVEWQSIENSTPTRGTVKFIITETGQLYGTRTSENLQGEGQEQAYPNQ